MFNTTSLTDSSGAVVERYEYHDYGFPLILDAAGEPSGVNALGLYASKVGNPRLFTGREWDGEAKVYQYRTRAYHPGLGRFMSVDRIGVWGDRAQLGNGFAGMAGNPLRWVDPWGTCSEEAPPGVPAQYRDPIYRDLWPELDKDNPANVVPLFSDEELRKQLEFYDRQWEDAKNKYDESGLKASANVGILVILTVSPIDEAAVAAWATARGLTLIRSAAGTIIGFVRGAKVVGPVAEKLADAARTASEVVGPGSGPAHGRQVHKEFQKIVDSMGDGTLKTERSFKDGEHIGYAARGSVRPDVVQTDAAGNIVAVYDLKTGTAKLTPERVQDLREHIPNGQNIPVIEVCPP